MEDFVLEKFKELQNKHTSTLIKSMRLQNLINNILLQNDNLSPTYADELMKIINEKE